MPISSLIAIALTVSLSAPANIQGQSIEQLVQTGNAALNDRRYSEAEATWREVIKREPKNIAAYLKLGDSLTISDQFEAAKISYRKAIELDPKRVDGYLALGELIMREFNANEAALVYREAIDRAAPSSEIYYMLGIALGYDPNNDRVFSESERSEIFRSFQKAVQINPQDGKSLVVLGGLWLQQGRMDKAIELFQAGMKLNYLDAYQRYENVLESQNRLAEMIPVYQKAIKDNPKADNLVGLYNGLASLTEKLGLLNDSEAAYRKALQLHPSSIYAYFSLGDALKKQGKDVEALSLYRKAAEIVRPDSLASPGDAFSYAQTGNMLTDRGLFDLAIATYRKAFELNPNDHLPYAWIGATLQKQGKLDEAFVYIRKSILLNPIGKKGYTLQKQGKLEESEKALRQAIGFYEYNRTGLQDKYQIEIAETQAETFRILQKVLVLQNRPNEALEIAEQGRSRALTELLATRLNKATAVTTTNQTKEALKAPNLQEIRSIAKTQNATLVEYSIIDDQQIYIWVVKPNGDIKFKVSQITTIASIPQLVEETRSAIRRGRNNAPNLNRTQTFPDFNLVLQQLHQALITPIASELPTNSNQQVIFLPQGDLFLIPFPALQDTKGSMLIDRHTISTAPSIQTLELTHEEAKLARFDQNNLIVGNPIMPIFQGIQLADLKGSEREAIAIGQILKTQPLLSSQATKAAVINQMQTASIIHLATHGLLNINQEGIPGAVALTPSGTDNGLLSASEIFDLKLRANLAVLSACDTGRGTITSDGVIGLSRSFIAAGVPSVVVSLWSVNDDSTQILMSDFYRNLQTNPSKASALRQAMLNTRKQYPEPRYWAAFTLIGESARPL